MKTLCFVLFTVALLALTVWLLEAALSWDWIGQNYVGIAVQACIPPPCPTAIPTP